MIKNPEQLPVEPLIPEIAKALAERGGAVLTAAPGSGKTTRVPTALLHEDWLAGRKIVLLEPRRLAVKAVARYMASMLGEQPGGTVGYRVRQESRISAKTRLEVVTEGVLIRMLQADPALEDVGLVIFDEFHERSLFADLGLALCLQSRELLRPDLRLLVMSATLDAGPVCAMLGGAPEISCEGRQYPVTTRYLGRSGSVPVEQAAAAAVRRAISEETGDVIVFLPGAPEIRKTKAILEEQGLAGEVAVLPLYGGLTADEQDRAIAPARPGERKVVLATSIAETSLTVEGVRVVIDCGLARRLRFSPRTGMSSLVTVPVSLDAAEQRRGRAGRLEPGVCYRLWTEQEEAMLPRSRPAEILESDLAYLALELAIWGVRDPAELSWLDPPPAAAYRQAVELLSGLNAVDEKFNATPHGRRMAELGVHPRLAHMMLTAKELGLGGLACELAALLQEGRIPPVAGASGGGVREGWSGADIEPRVEALRSGRGAFRPMLEEARRLKRLLGVPEEGEDDLRRCGLLLACAYPDRIGGRRAGGGFLLASGRGAAFPREEPLSFSPHIVAAELDDRGADGRILLAARVEEEDIRRHLPHLIASETAVYWDRNTKSARSVARERIGAIRLRERPGDLPPETETDRVLLEGIRQEGLKLLNWSKSSLQLIDRLDRKSVV